MSQTAVKFDRVRDDLPENVLKAWTVRSESDETVTDLGLLAQSKKDKHEWLFAQKGVEPKLVGESKLTAISQVRSMFVEIVQAPAPTASEPSATEQIEARIAQLEAEIAEVQGKPEFTRAAAARRGQITRLRKQLPTSASTPGVK